MNDNKILTSNIVSIQFEDLQMSCRKRYNNSCRLLCPCAYDLSKNIIERIKNVKNNKESQYLCDKENCPMLLNNKENNKKRLEQQTQILNYLLTKNDNKDI